MATGAFRVHGCQLTEGSRSLAEGSGRCKEAQSFVAKGFVAKKPGTCFVGKNFVFSWFNGLLLRTYRLDFFSSIWPVGKGQT